MAQYTFTTEFQRDLLRAMALDDGFLHGTRKALEEAYFTTPELSAAAGAILRVFDITGAVPSMGSVLESLREECPADVDADEVEASLRTLYAEEAPKDVAFIRSRAADFGRHQRVQAVLTRSQDYVHAADYDGLNNALREASTVRADSEDEVYVYDARVMERMDAAAARIQFATPTSVAALDKHLDDGGLGKAEMGILIGLPGFGKSTTLVNIGYGALMAGRNVFHVSVGDMTEYKVGIRYDARITGRSVYECRMAPKTTAHKVGTFMESTGGAGRLVVKFWPAYRINPMGLERYIRWLMSSQGFKPDVLVVDYGANMGANRPGLETRFAHAEIYKELRALGGVFDCAVWSAQQANRLAFDCKAPGMKEAAEAFEPCRDADVIIGVGGDKNRGIMYLRGAKVRDSASDWLETAYVNFQTHTIQSDGEFKPSAENDDERNADSTEVDRGGVGAVPAAGAEDNVRCALSRGAA